tara:strand:+ start:846 stop:992 length:147 start_codon:yes stop_codon:yes gene_type:complete
MKRDKKLENLYNIICKMCNKCMVLDVPADLCTECEESVLKEIDLIEED